MAAGKISEINLWWVFSPCSVKKDKTYDIVEALNELHIEITCHFNEMGKC